MNKQKISAYLNLLAVPGVLCLMGIVLLVNPDSATMLLSRLLGWALEILALLCILSAIFRPGNNPMKIVCGIACLCIGGWLIRNPMALAAAGGLAVGVLLIIRGAQEWKNGRGWAVVIMVLGLLLVLLPLTTSRLLFALCGLVMLAAGVLMGIDRLRRGRLESGSDDPNIIDAL